MNPALFLTSLARRSSTPPIRAIAHCGDSLQEQATTGLRYLNARGAFCWAQVFNRQRWKIVGSGTEQRFATAGYTTQQVISIHLPGALASSADSIFLHTGQNDKDAGLTPAQSAALIRSAWATIKAAGKRPIGSTLTGWTTGSAQQAWVVACNILLRAYAVADGVLLVDWAAINNTSGTDDGILNPIYSITADPLHWNGLGASRLGRVYAATIAPYLDNTVDPFANRTNVSANPTWSGGPPPTSWNSFPGSGNAAPNGSMSYTAANDPSKWWQIVHTQGGGNSSSVISFTDTIPSPVGLNFEAIMELRVISGGLYYPALYANLEGGTALDYRALYHADATSADQITAADGIVALRTPVIPGVTGNTNVYPTFLYAGNATLELRRPAIYQLP